MKNYKAVELPTRTVVVHNKSGNYVYLTQGVKYISDKKRTVPSRIAIGKLNEDGKLIPNKNYFEIFGNDIECVDPTNRSDYISIGLHLVSKHISDYMQLIDLMESIFGDDYKKILDIAMYLVSTQSNAMTYFEDYGYSHSLFNEVNFSDNTIGRLFNDIKTKDIDAFIKGWIRIHCKEDIYVAYDSTNMNCTAGNLELVEYGYAKDNNELPQVNVSLGYNQTDHIPLMYELYPGSIIDNSECKKMVDRAVHYGCKHIGFILDRGYFSIENIKYFERNGYDYILMTKGNASFIKEALKECSARVKHSHDCYIEEHELYGITLEKQILTNKKKYIHVYYNGIQAEKEKIELLNQISKTDKILKDKLENYKLSRREDLKAYETYYTVDFDDNGYFKSYSIKQQKLEKALEQLGYFVIITSQNMDASQALDIYRERDAVEKVFRMEKSYLGFDSFRVHNQIKMESKMFISFIALILRNEISQKIKPLYKKNRKEYTVPKVIQQLERIGLTKLSDALYHQRYVLTKKQKSILASFDINTKEYESFIDEIKGKIQ